MEKIGDEVSKKTKQFEEVNNKNEKKKTGVLHNLLLWLIIPLLSVSAVLLIIAKAADINVFNETKKITEKIPIIGKQIAHQEDENEVVFEQRVIDLQAEIQEKEAKLNKLQRELDQSKELNEQLLIEQEKLLNEIAKLEREKDDSKRQFQEIVATFEHMSAKSAAPVITNMSDAEAIRILTSLKPDTLAAILEKMSPENAAKYTSMMTK